MDCAKVEMLLMDVLYGEADSPTIAAVEEHAASCEACREKLKGLRATRSLLKLDLEPINLEERILAAALPATKPKGGRVIAFLSRPQMAVAAAFLLVAGLSIYAFRASKKMESQVTASASAQDGERAKDQPAKEAELAKNEPAAPAPPAAASASVPLKALEDTRDLGGKSFAKGRFADAIKEAEPHAATDPNAALMVARSVEKLQGCGAAAPKYDALAARDAGAPSNDAQLEAARCYQSMGNALAARQRYNGLLGNTEYEPRARAELDRLDEKPKAAAQPVQPAKPTATATTIPAPATRPPSPAPQATMPVNK